MAIPTHLYDASAGAPTLNGTTGAMYDVLKWALPQVGWTLAYDDAAGHRAAFRNDPVSGTGYYLMIWDDPADHAGDARVARIQIFLDMTDIDTGVDPVYSVERYVAKSPTLDTTAQEWHIIGDSLRFHLMRQAGGDGFNWYTFGDGKNYFASDNTLFICPLTTNNNPISQGGAHGISRLAYTSADGIGVDVTDVEEAVALDYSGVSSATVRFRSFPPDSDSAAIPGSSGTVLDTSNPAARVIIAEGWEPRGEIVGGLNPLQDRPYGFGWQLLSGVVHNGNEITDVLYFNCTPYAGESNPNRGSIYIDIGSDWSNW